MSLSVKFFVGDSSALSDSDNVLFHDDLVESIILMLVVKETEKVCGSKMGHLCLPWNQSLGHEMLIKLSLHISLSYLS
jgi:hypothetical protein